MKQHDSNYNLGCKMSRFSEIVEENINEEYCLMSSSNDFHVNLLFLTFKLSLKEPSLKEMEQIEEEKLLDCLNQMNMSFKCKDKKYFLETINNLYTHSPELNSNIFKNDNNNENYSKIKFNIGKRSLSFDGIDNIEANIKLNMKTNRSKMTKQSYDTNESSISFQSTYFSSFNDNSNSKQNSSLENLITQNLVIADEVLKLLVLGDRAVGKSLLLNQIVNKTAGDYSHYEPTKR
jgi:hypothetical protein